MGKGALATRSSRYFTPDVVEQLETLEQDLGGRQALVGMLVLAPLTPDLRYVLGLLGDPKYAAKSLATICAIGNILPADLLKHLASAALLRGKVLASQRIGDGIAAVAEDVMRRAAPYEDACNGGCQGTGSIVPEPTAQQPNPIPQPCEVCRGTGKLVYQPDLERQKLAIDMAQLLPKGSGIQIAQINQTGGREGNGMGPLETLTRLTDQLLYGDHPAEPEVEGEVLPEDPAP